jgi:hypothetical protein
MPVENIEVKSNFVSWSVPYKRLAFGLEPDKELLRCNNQEYMEATTSITNGLRTKNLFDCKRGLYGVFHDEQGDPAKAITGFVRNNGSRQSEFYFGVCYRVTHERPYEPE